MELEDSLANYTKATDIIKETVENKSGLQVPEYTTRAWHNMLVAMRLLDDIIDNSVNVQNRSKLGSDIVGFLNSDENIPFDFNPRSTEALILLRSDINILNQDKKTSFIGSITLALKVGERIKQADNPKDFALLTRLEGQVLSRLFVHFLPDEFQEGDFPRWFHRLGRVGNLYDSFVDWSSDYKNQETIIYPSPKNRLVAMNQARSDIWYLLTHSQPTLFGALLGHAVSFARKEPTYT